MLNSPPANRRHTERMPMSVRVVLLVDPEGQGVSYVAHMVDISRTGARLETNARLTAGQIIEVMPSTTGEAPIPGRVVWATNARPDSRGEVGIEFLAPCPTTVWGEALAA